MGEHSKRAGEMRRREEEVEQNLLDEVHAAEKKKNEGSDQKNNKV